MIYPLRYLVFVSLGCIVLFGMNNCVPEMSDINPPQNVEKKILTLSKYGSIIISEDGVIF